MWIRTQDKKIYNASQFASIESADVVTNIDEAVGNSSPGITFNEVRYKIVAKPFEGEPIQLALYNSRAEVENVLDAFLKSQSSNFDFSQDFSPGGGQSW